MHIKKGDMVEIIAGEDKGATGRVLRVLPGKIRWWWKVRTANTSMFGLPAGTLRADGFKWRCL